MKISCIIPTCDRPDFLPETIKSVIVQTRRPDEIIVVNNGKEKVSLPDNLSGQIKVIDIKPYAGVSCARNAGVKMSSGEYIAFIDDDDLWSKKYLENVSEAINEGHLCIVSRLDSLEDGKVTSPGSIDDMITIENLLTFNPGVTGSNLVIAKDLFLKVGGYDVKLPSSEDKSLILEVIKTGTKIKTLSNNQAIIRRHGNIRLSNNANLAEGVYCFTRKYKKIMSRKQYLINWFKICKYRKLSGNKLAVIPYFILAVLVKLINKKKKLNNLRQLVN